jgi:hypothetical protein
MSGTIDKGHKAQFVALVKKIKEGGEPLIPFEELVNSTKTTFAALQSLQEGTWINIV